MTEAPTSDDARWAEAQSILDGAPSAAAEEALRRRRRARRQLVVSLIAFVVLSAVVTAALVVGADRHSGPRRAHIHPAGWQVALGLTLTAVGLLIALVGLALQFRSNRRLGAWRSPLLVLTRQQRKELRAQVRCTTPEDPARLPLARHLATLLVGQRKLLLLNLGLLLNAVASALENPSPAFAVLPAVWGVLLVVVGGLVERDARCAQRFLAAHPAEVSDRR